MHTGLSPEWDRGFDEAFTDLVSHDADLVRAEFTGLIQQAWPTRSGPGDTTGVGEDRKQIGRDGGPVTPRHGPHA